MVMFARLPSLKRGSQKLSKNDLSGVFEGFPAGQFAGSQFPDLLVDEGLFGPPSPGWT